MLRDTGASRGEEGRGRKDKHESGGGRGPEAIDRCAAEVGCKQGTLSMCFVWTLDQKSLF
eukprot:40753-Pelagomonas_calceolata.AAC.3